MKTKTKDKVMEYGIPLLLLIILTSITFYYVELAENKYEEPTNVGNFSCSCSDSGIVCICSDNNVIHHPNIMEHISNNSRKRVL